MASDSSRGQTGRTFLWWRIVRGQAEPFYNLKLMPKTLHRLYPSGTLSTMRPKRRKTVDQREYPRCQLAAAEITPLFTRSQPQTSASIQQQLTGSYQTSWLQSAFPLPRPLGLQRTRYKAGFVLPGGGGSQRQRPLNGSLSR